MCENGRPDCGLIHKYDYEDLPPLEAKVWLTLCTDPDEYHVVPWADVVIHEIVDSNLCPCLPTIKVNYQDNPMTIGYVHHAWDDRKA